MKSLEQKLIDKIKPYEAVSFDIYDTLVKRCVVTPNDIFEVVANKFNKQSMKKISVEDFRNDRALAGKKAKEHLKNGLEETTLADIYEELPDFYKDIRTFLMRIELQQEANCCVANACLKRVYSWCVKEKKKIYIISDMYLPIDTIKVILEKCGYSDYEKLYLSSDVEKRKRSGHLFDYFLKDAGLEASKVIHIGNDIRSDYLQALKKGIYSVKIPTATANHKYRRLCSSRKPEYNKIERLIGNLSDSCWNEYFQYGFEVVGPALYGFTIWLHNTALKKENSKLFFLARDGYLMQKSYIKLYGDDALENNYIYVSRKSMAPAELRKGSELTQILELETPYHYWCIDELCETLGVNIKVGREIWNECGLSLDQKLIKKDLLSNIKVKAFYEKVSSQMKSTAEEKTQTIVKYLKQEGFTGNIIIIDVGWAGTIQKYLQKLIHDYKIDAQIYGCYFGLKPDALNASNIISYIPKEAAPSLFCSQLMEYPFTQLIGTTFGYKENEDGEVFPDLADYEYEGKEDAESTELIQKGMMYFIDVMAAGYSVFEPRDYTVFYDNLKNATKRPRIKDVNILGNLTHVNHGSVTFLANPKSLFYYFTHMKELKYDFGAAGWKIGFMKKLLKLPLPYNSILSALRNG